MPQRSLCGLAKQHGVKGSSLLFIYSPTGLFAGRGLALFKQRLSALHPILSRSRTVFRGEMDQGCPPRRPPPTRLHSVFGKPGVWLDAALERVRVVASPRWEANDFGVFCINSTLTHHIEVKVGRKQGPSGISQKHRSQIDIHP